MATTVKFYAAEKAEVNEDDRSIIARITTEIIDRDREIVLANGADLDNYRKNPVVLWAHDYQGTPVAKNLWIRSDNRGLIAKTQYAKTAKAEEIWQLRKGGYLSGYSIGFITKNGKTADGLLAAGPPHEKELRNNPEWKDARVIHRSWELVEYSDVPVPCNPEALSRAYQGKSLAISPETAKELQIQAPTIDDLIARLVGKDNALQSCVSAKIPKLIDEGYEQDQAVAIAYSMCREKKEAPKAYSFSAEDLLAAAAKAMNKENEKIRKQLAAELPEMVKECLHVARGGV